MRINTQMKVITFDIKDFICQFNNTGNRNNHKILAKEKYPWQQINQTNPMHTEYNNETKLLPI